MIDADVKDVLGVANNTVEKRRKDFLSEEIYKEYVFSEELYLHRKMLKELLNAVSKLHPGEIDCKNFIEYYNKVEELSKLSKDKFLIGDATNG